RRRRRVRRSAPARPRKGARGSAQGICVARGGPHGVWFERGLKEYAMAKLRHIAIAAEDPFATAEFYKQAFEFKEVRRLERSDVPGKSYGVFLTDGTLNMAILHFGWDQGLGLDFRGIHHFGVLVDNVDEMIEKLESLGAKCFARRPESQK